MRKAIFLSGVVFLSLFLTLNSGFALSIQTQLWFEPAEQLYDVGDSIAVELYADIAQEDAVFGFGFDLSFDEGATYITGPGDSGNYLTFTGFAVNSTLFDDPFSPPLWDDGDGIAGAVDIFSDDVWGTNLLLGTFLFEAPGSVPIGLETIFLGAPDSDDPFYPDGLLIGDPFEPITLMPNTPTASVAPIPEPATILLLTTGVLGMGAFGRRKMKIRK